MAQHKFDLQVTVWADDGAYFPKWVQDAATDDSLEDLLATWIATSAEKIAGVEVDQVKTTYVMSVESINAVSSPLDSIQSIDGNVITVDFESENVESDQPE